MLINNSSNDPKGFPTNFREVPETLQKSLTPVQKDFDKANSLQYPTEFITKIPHHGNSTSITKSIQPDSKSDIAQINVKLNAYLAANTAKPIYAKNDADFSKAKDQYISDIKAIGEDKLVKWFSDKYIEMKDKVKNMK